MVGGSCGYENKNFTQSLSECQGPVTGIGVWLRGMRIPIHLALWLKMSLSLSLKLERERMFWKCEWEAFLYWRILILRNLR